MNKPVKPQRTEELLPGDVIVIGSDFCDIVVWVSSDPTHVAILSKKGEIEIWKRHFSLDDRLKIIRAGEEIFSRVNQ